MEKSINDINEALLRNNAVEKGLHKLSPGPLGDADSPGNPSSLPFSLINLTEYVVLDRLDTALDTLNCCKCDKCRRDAIAIALNSLPAHYIVTEPDRILGLMSRQDSNAAIVAIMQAVEVVAAHPRHEPAY